MTTAVALAPTLPTGLPDGAEMERIAFNANSADGQAVGQEFDEKRYVLPLQDGVAPAGPALELLKIPLRPGDEPGFVEKARIWVEGHSGNGHNRAIILTLQGVELVWSPGQVAVLAQPDRIALARRAVIEFTFYEYELRAIEQAVARGWPELESDSPMTFDFNEKTMRQRQKIGKRVQESIALRCRLARLAPQLSHPVLFPPTLASQIGERLRERLRTQERLEFLDRQLDVFERVYDMCNMRVNEFMLGRKENTLEMIIIVLLAAQLLFQALGYMARLSE